MGYELEKPRTGVREYKVALTSDTRFEDIVKVLEKTLTIPELPGVRGCAPCLSGLDRFVIQSDLLATFR